MPKCVKCQEAFHPDYSVIVDEATGACKCSFCYMDRNEITIINESTGEVLYTVTRKEASENYRRYLKDLKDNPKIRKILMGEKKSKIIQ